MYAEAACPLQTYVALENTEMTNDPYILVVHVFITCKLTAIAYQM